MTPRELLTRLPAGDTAVRAACAAAYGDHHELTEAACARVWALARHYADAYSADDEIVLVRAPGRVNLIGEHTDYNGLPVMPMAISRDVLVMAARATGGAVQITNVEGMFEPRNFALARHIPPYQPGDWGNYVKSAMQGLIDYWQSADGLSGMRMAISGNVPVASGLSSSAAFTIACALALLHTHQRALDPLVFADVMAHSDHYVGMASGGMDQAASILGRAGACLKIDFFPLRVQPVNLPPQTAIVVCHSRVKAAKAGNARDEYNRRVVECRLATAVLHAFTQAAGAREPALLSEWLAWNTRGLDDALAQINAHLHPEGYRLAELAHILQRTPEQLSASVCVTKAGTRCDEPADGYQLLKRARHVISETRRVEAALSLLSAMPDDAAHRFGELMNQSHASCRDDYAISCPELEELVTAAREAGAYGARLTGAGFGGCTVNLVRADATAAFIDAVARAYYAPKHLDPRADNIFVFAPASGAGLLLASSSDSL